MKPSTAPGQFSLMSTALQIWKSMGLKEEFDWSAPPSKKFKRVKVPDLVASSYSSSRDTDEYEDLDDTAAGPAPTHNPDNAGAPPST